MTTVSSERLGTIEPAQLQAALDRFELGRLRDVRPASAGLFGQNLFVTSDTGRWVFRGAPHWPWQFAKERWFAEGLHAQTSAPVPWPFLVEPSTEIFGWGYAWMAHLPGACPAYWRDRVGAGERVGIAEAVGHGLAALQELTAPASGEYDPDLGGVCAQVCFGDWVLASLDSWIAKCAEIDSLEPADREWIDAVREPARDALGVPFEPTFVHHDFKGGNLHVDRARGRFRVTGVFDLMTAAFGDGEQDLSRMTAELSSRPDEARAFLDAYRRRRPLRPGCRERFRLYMLIDRLVLWEYGRRNRVWFPDRARFRGFAAGFVALDSLLGEGD